MRDLCLLAEAGHISDSELASAAETIVALQIPQLQEGAMAHDFLNTFIPMLRFLRSAGLPAASPLRSRSKTAIYNYTASLVLRARDDDFSLLAFIVPTSPVSPPRRACGKPNWITVGSGAWRSASNTRGRFTQQRQWYGSKSTYLAFLSPRSASTKQQRSDVPATKQQPSSNQPTTNQQPTSN